MCGIAGIAGRGWDRSALEAMVGVQRHRGPDDFGVMVTPDGCVGLGHNRLSIIDLSAAGHQPMWNAHGDVALVFNGEIYNYLELRSELKGYPFKSQSDTEVLLAAYERWGEQCVERFNGMFGFGIWDARRRTLVCARDRLGIKPLYYALERDHFLFSSEIKAILTAGFSPRMDRAAVYDYLVHGQYDHTDRTFFEGIRSLPPGHLLVWRDGRCQVRPFWELADHIDPDPAREASPDWAEHLEELLLDSVRLRLRSDVPVGVHLTGGLDSSSVVALLDDVMPGQGSIKAHTGTYGDAAYDEIVYASEVTRTRAVELQTYPLRVDELWDVLSHTQWHQEQPFGGIATAVYWDMEAGARRAGTVVLLEGQGGDELFGGYSYYLGDHVGDLSRVGGDTAVESLLANYGAVHGLDREQLRRRVDTMLGQAGRTYQDGSTYLRPDCLSRSFLEGDSIGAAFVSPSSSDFTNARLRDIRYTKLPRVLRFNDRMSMAFGCELRVPLLDHRIVETSFGLPNHLMMHKGLPKWPLRAAVGRRLPDHIRLATKRAVVTPQRELFRGRLRAEIEDRLRNSKLGECGVLEPGMAVAAFAEFCEDASQTNSFFIWQWLNLDLWMDVFKPGTE